MKRFFGLSSHEWVGLLFFSLFVIPLGFLSVEQGVFAEEGSASTTSKFPSSDITMLRGTPLVLYAAPGSCGSRSITLYWNRDDQQYRFKLYRDAKEVFTGVASYSFTDTNLQPGVLYSYRLLAYVPENQNEVSATEVSVVVNAPSSCSNVTTTGTTTNSGGTDGTISTTTTALPGTITGPPTNTMATTSIETNETRVATTSYWQTDAGRVQGQLPLIPASTYLRPGQEVQFSVPEYARTGAVVWRVVEGAAGGTITANGLYRAPLSSGTYRVGASISGSSYGPGEALVYVSGQSTVQTVTERTVESTSVPQADTVTQTATPAPRTTTRTASESERISEGEERGVVSTDTDNRVERALPEPDAAVVSLPPLTVALRTEAVRLSSLAEITNQKETAIDAARTRILAAVGEEERPELEALIREALDVPFPDIAEVREALATRIREPEVVAAITEATEVLEGELAVHAASLKEVGGERLYSDTNNDGISDYESERVYGLDPAAPARTSMYRGRTIGPKEKLLLGYDPASVELIPIVPEPPQTAEVDPTDAYRVEEVELTEEKKVTLSGRALPNNFITIFAYSTPVVVTVKTDEDGTWSYTFEKELPDGTHTVYTATVNNSGKILAKSSGYLFTKTAEAATLDSVLPDVAPQNAKPRFLMFDTIVVIVGAVAFFLFVVLLTLGRRTPISVEPLPRS